MVDGLSRFLCVFNVLSGSHTFVVLDQSNAIYHFQDYSRYMTINDFSRFSSLISYFFSPTIPPSLSPIVYSALSLTHCLFHVSCMLSTSLKNERMKENTVTNFLLEKLGNLFAHFIANGNSCELFLGHSDWQIPIDCITQCAL